MGDHIKYDVLIPIVDKSHNPQLSGGERLWLVYARPANKLERQESATHKKDGEIPTIRPLMETGQYLSAIRPYKAIERLLAIETILLKKPEQTLENWRLNSDGGEWASQIDGDSTDLGIALCLLMAHKLSTVDIIGATGALGDSQDSHIVKPVAQIGLKLQWFLEQKRLNKLPENLKIIFTPHQQVVWHDGVPILEPVATMPEVAQLDALGIIVYPVATLGDAAEKLGIDIKTELRWFNRLRRIKQGVYWALASAMAAAAGLLLWVLLWLHSPIDVSFQPPDINWPAAPYVIGTDKQPVPINDQRQLATGAELAWRVRLGAAEEVQSLRYRLAKAFGYSGLKVLLVTIGQCSGVKIGDSSIVEPTESHNLPPGRLWSYAQTLGSQQEAQLFMILVNRHKALNIEMLKQPYLNQQALDLAAITQAFLNKADGGVSYRFTTQTEGRPCDTQQR